MADLLSTASAWPDGRVDERGSPEAARRGSVVVERVGANVVLVVPRTGRDAIPGCISVGHLEPSDHAADLHSGVGRNGRSFDSAGVRIVRPAVRGPAHGLGVGLSAWRRRTSGWDGWGVRTARTGAASRRSAGAVRV